MRWILIVVFAFGCTKPISAEHVAQEIVKLLKSKGVTHAAAQCPNALERKKGAHVQCRTADTEGVKMYGDMVVATPEALQRAMVTADVTVVDDEGTLDIKLGAIFVDSAALKQAVAARDDVNIRCPMKTLVITPAQTVACEALGTSKWDRIEVRVTDLGKNAYDWTLIPQ
jgi:hypothetical protein